MSELDKMGSGAYYDFSAPEIMDSIRHARRCLERFNRAGADDEPARREALGELIPGIPASATVVPPFFCDHGHPIRLGEGVFVNTGCTFLDSGGITVGARTLIGPDCRLLTPEHPIDSVARRRPIERGRAITIGEDCWLCGGVTVCPGVRIGDGAVVAAGSVVTRDVPDDALVAGNPAVVKRMLR